MRLDKANWKRGSRYAHTAAQRNANDSRGEVKGGVNAMYMTDAQTDR